MNYFCVYVVKRWFFVAIILFFVVKHHFEWGGYFNV